MATHSSVLAWNIPWTEEPGGLTVHGVTESWAWLSMRTCTFRAHSLGLMLRVLAVISLVWKDCVNRFFGDRIMGHHVITFVSLFKFGDLVVILVRSFLSFFRVCFSDYDLNIEGRRWAVCFTIPNWGSWYLGVWQRHSGPFIIYIYSQ